MRQNLGQLIDGCMSRIANPAQVGEGAFIAEINHAAEELHSRIRDQRAEWLVRQTYVNVKNTIDTYVLPEFVGDVMLVERRITGAGYWPLQRTSVAELANWDQLRNIQLRSSDVYAWVDRDLVIRPVPEEDAEKGLRVTYQPRYVPMEDIADTPSLPVEVHEWIIVAAVDRLRQYDDVILSRPEEFERFRIEQDARLIRFLAPRHLDAPSVIGDEDPYYIN